MRGGKAVSQWQRDHEAAVVERFLVVFSRDSAFARLPARFNCDEAHVLAWLFDANDAPALAHTWREEHRPHCANPQKCPALRVLKERS
ncbi:hypothetical protein [Amycolatopsis sp. NPDC004079]|uniref:hypothetical protein n=1 Tax=Amycolatopsis sp. NPDC004079 TaxID=3154549 RepID=UPI0033A597D0